jgi:hypothetical protein
LLLSTGNGSAKLREYFCFLLSKLRWFSSTSRLIPAVDS